MSAIEPPGTGQHRHPERSRTGLQAYQTGLAAEELVCYDLRQHGFTVLEHRWSVAHTGEIDLIAARQNRLLLIEVKARRLYRYTGTLAKEALSAGQARRIWQCGLSYIQSRQLWDYIVELWLASCQLSFDGRLLALTYYPCPLA
ncbi:MAG: YraN family protein [Oscillospiraceae bacterium]|nr:YraN family protein [Oscillospiraceae bacterium]MDD4368000.1 YraN family protein [Oscillospiraceae bacterium]